jgi:hypothetical protein
MLLLLLLLLVVVVVVEGQMVPVSSLLPPSVVRALHRLAFAFAILFSQPVAPPSRSY